VGGRRDTISRPAQDAAVTRRVLQLAFWIALAVWTVLLVRPTPKEAVTALTEWSDILPWLVSKALHVTGYAGFAVGALVLFRYRWWVLGGVAVHAVLGELGQYLGDEWFATGRVGSVKDVFIDWTGMALGCGLWWAWRKVMNRAATGRAATARERCSPEGATGNSQG
jgi:hypothetical protein